MNRVGIECCPVCGLLAGHKLSCTYGHRTLEFKMSSGQRFHYEIGTDCEVVMTVKGPHADLKCEGVIEMRLK